MKNLFCCSQGWGIPDTKIFVNGKEMGASDTEGIYHLVGMKTGHYEISATAEQLYFDGTKVKITPNTPQLPDLIAARYEPDTHYNNLHSFLHTFNCKYLLQFDTEQLSLGFVHTEFLALSVVDIDKKD